MIRYLFSSTVLLLCFLASSCGSEQSRVTMYVLVAPASASRFIDDLASFSRAHSLNPSAGRAIDDRGHTLRVIEARGRGIRLWGQNLPLSGHEDPVMCGRHTEAYPDPGQFILIVEPRLSLLSGGTSGELAAQLHQDLSRRGYEVLRKPATCSSFAKSGSHS